MKVSKFNCKPFFMKKVARISAILLLLSTKTLLAVPGWYSPVQFSEKTEEYAVHEGGYNGAIYAVSVVLPSKFSVDRDTVCDIYVHSFNGFSVKTVKATTVVLSKSLFLFSLNPTIAASDNRVLLVWQQPSKDGRGTDMKYISASISDFVFSQPQTVQENEYDGSLPKLKVSGDGIFHLFYQKRVESNRFSLMHARFTSGKFSGFHPIIGDMAFIGRGAFFPSIVLDDSEIYVLYQSRQEQTLRDELYYVQSTNAGKSFGKLARITENDFNDFSPYMIMRDQKIEYVWQANPEGNWAIYYAVLGEKPQKITTSKSDSFMPVMTFNEKNGHVMAWFDQRVVPPQIYAIFSDADPELPIGKEHRVTRGKAMASEPFLTRLNNDVFLFYLQGSRLYAVKTDKETAPVQIYSPTHAEGKSTNQTDVSIEWIIKNEPSGVDAIAYLVDDRPDSNPDLYNLDGDKKDLLIKDVAGGRYYFHIKYRDGAGNESSPYSYPFIVDSGPPKSPVISSTTHQEGIPVDAKNFTVQFSSEDDIGVRGYYYAFSENRGEALESFTENGELTFTDISAGRYYFMVRAEDMAGKLSPVAVYSIEVVPEDYADFFVKTNIADSRVQAENFELEINLNLSEKGIAAIKGSIARKKVDPYIGGDTWEFDQLDNTHTVIRPFAALKPGLYAFSLGLEYTDGTHSIPRYYYFEYKRPKVEKPSKPITFDTRWRRVQNYFYEPASYEKTLPTIRISAEGDLFEVEFNIQDEMKGLVRGYSYRLADIPSLPEEQINYIKTPIYLYNLTPGVYYLSVRAVFTKNEFNEKAGYSYVRFVVTAPFLWQDPRFHFGLVLIILLLIGLRQRKKLLFYFGRFRLS